MLDSKIACDIIQSSTVINICILLSCHISMSFDWRLFLSLADSLRRTRLILFVLLLFGIYGLLKNPFLSGKGCFLFIRLNISKTFSHLLIWFMRENKDKVSSHPLVYSPSPCRSWGYWSQEPGTQVLRSTAAFKFALPRNWNHEPCLGVKSRQHGHPNRHLQC